MKETLNNEIPLFVQIKQKIENMIVDRTLMPGDQIPSSTEMVKFYQINHLTVLKGIHMLVDEGLIYKKRGVGMFVSDNAHEILIKKRRDQLISHYIIPLIKEAEHLGITIDALTKLIKNSVPEKQHNSDIEYNSKDKQSSEDAGNGN